MPRQVGVQLPVETQEAIVKAYVETKTPVMAIAFDNGTSVATVYKVLYMWGVEINRDRSGFTRNPIAEQMVIALYQKGAQIIDIETATSLSPATIYGVLRKHGVELRRMKSAQRLEVLKQARRRRTVYEIAEETGLDIAKVRAVIKAGGLELYVADPASLVSNLAAVTVVATVATVDVEDVDGKETLP